jgi:hypothetical protein
MVEDGTRPHRVSERGPEIYLSTKILSGLIFDADLKAKESARKFRMLLRQPEC